MTKKYNEAKEILENKLKFVGTKDMFYFKYNENTYFMLIKKKKQLLKRF